MKAKKMLKWAAGILLALVLVLAAYVIYVFAAYHRIEDKQVIKPEHNVERRVEAKTPYTITTFNIGFGAYSADYSFFMDGGSESRAFSKDAVVENTKGAAELIKEINPDFAFFQEVDTDSTRSYHVNQYTMLKETFSGKASTFALNYDSPYLFYPILEPHGKSRAGIATFSDYAVESCLRRSLPIDTGVGKLVDLDRCYSVTRLSVKNGKDLCLFNIHLSAYTKDNSVREEQLKMLGQDMEEEYKKGNYVICAGDFNQDLYGNSGEIFKAEQKTPEWAQAFPRELLPKGLALCLPKLSDNPAPTCRNADKPYKEGKTFVTVLDGFILSDNVEALEVEHIDAGFQYSDHNPVKLKFCLR